MKISPMMASKNKKESSNRIRVDEIDQLIEQYLTSSGEDQKAIYEKIEAFGVDGIQKIVDKITLESPSQYYFHKLHHFFENGGEKMLAPLLAVMNTDGRDTRTTCIEALGEIGPVSMPILFQLIKDDDKIIRRYAAWSLAHLGEPALDQLIKGLSDRSSKVRVESAVAIGNMDDAEMARRAIPALIANLQDKNGQVRKQAIWALGEIGNPEEIEAIIPYLNDNIAIVRASAAEVLSKQKTERFREALIAALQDSNWKVRYHATNGLWTRDRAIDPDDVLKLLKALWHEEQRKVVELLLWCLDKTWKNTPEVLLEALHHEDDDIRTASALIISRDPRSECFDDLVDALDDSNYNVRKFALRALASKRGIQALKPAVKMLRDDDEEVVEEAINALEKIAQNIPDKD
jgi:HEAT repeat protein